MNSLSILPNRGNVWMFVAFIAHMLSFLLTILSHVFFFSLLYMHWLLHVLWDFMNYRYWLRYEICSNPFMRLHYLSILTFKTLVFLSFFFKSKHPFYTSGILLVSLCHKVFPNFIVLTGKCLFFKNFELNSGVSSS